MTEEKEKGSHEDANRSVNDGYQTLFRSNAGEDALNEAEAANRVGGTNEHQANGIDSAEISTMANGVLVQSQSALHANIFARLGHKIPDYAQEGCAQKVTSCIYWLQLLNENDAARELLFAHADEIDRSPNQGGNNFIPHQTSWLSGLLKPCSARPVEERISEFLRLTEVFPELIDRRFLDLHIQCFVESTNRFETLYKFTPLKGTMLSDSVFEELENSVSLYIFWKAGQYKEAGDYRKATECIVENVDQLPERMQGLDYGPLGGPPNRKSFQGTGAMLLLDLADMTPGDEEDREIDLEKMSFDERMRLIEQLHEKFGEELFGCGVLASAIGRITQAQMKKYGDGAFLSVYYSNVDRLNITDNGKGYIKRDLLHMIDASNSQNPLIVQAYVQSAFGSVFQSDYEIAEAAKRLMTASS